MVSKIIINKKELQIVIKKIREYSEIRFLKRINEPEKDPFRFMQELNIDASDAEKIIRDLTEKEYKYTQLDSKNKFTYMYVFRKIIEGKEAYIKIGFKDDKKTIVISFHKTFR